MPAQFGLDGRGDNANSVPRIIISLASDPDNVTLVPLPASKADAERMACDMYSLHSRAQSILLRQRMITTDARVVWVSVTPEDWSSVIRDGDELRVFQNPSELKPQWERVPATIIYGTWKRVMLLSDNYKVTKDDVYSKLKPKLPRNITSDDFRLQLITGGPNAQGQYEIAMVHQRGDPPDEWRDLVQRLNKEQRDIKLLVTI